jgi:HEXXH motif-containing protein
VKTHSVPSEVFDLLARGDGDTQGVLRSGQRSKRLLLLRELLAEARARVPRLCAEAATDEAFAVLADAQRSRPDVVDDLLLQPHVGAWATHCIRALVRNDDLAPADLGHLGTVAASAAARAGLAFAVTAHLRDDGSLMFPTFGLARPTRGPGWCRLRSRTGEAVEITTAATTTSIDLWSRVDTPAWQPLRRLRSSAHGVTIDVHLDDLDPYRSSDEIRTTGRLRADDVVAWQECFDGAWESITVRRRDQAIALASGTMALVPTSQPERHQMSATRHDAPGAIALARPRSARSLVQALVHEYQHTKLCMLLDLVPLVASASEVRLYSPWRDDPRPLQGLLHGSYAYLGLAGHVDQECRQRVGDEAAANLGLAQFELAMWRDQVGRVLGSLRRPGGLTSGGRRFVETMRARLRDLRRSPVPSRPRLLARAACLDHEISWRLRNIVPDPQLVDEYSRAWLAGRRAPTVSPGVPVEPINRTMSMPSDARLGLMRRQFELPDDPALGRTDISVGDERFVRGDLSGAAEAYRDDILAKPCDAPSWAGLALVRRYLPNDAVTALTKMPELVFAVHQRVHEASGKAADPERLAAWMAVPPATS